MLVEWYKTTALDMKDAADALCVLCIGSCEQHADYLPVGTDGFIGDQIVREAAKKAARKVMLLPALQYGYSPHHRAFPGFITLRQSTLKDLVTDICLSVMQNGLKHMLLVNAHGGNQSSLQAAVNEMGENYGMYPVLVRYWDLITAGIRKIRETEAGGMGHAGELETSLMLHYHPKLVKKERIKNMPPAQGNAWHNPDMFAKNPVYIYKPFDRYSPLGNIGQPQFADAEKGKKIAGLIAEKLAQLMDFCTDNDF